MDRFRQNIQKLNFMKIRPVGAELFHDDGRTDRHMVKQVSTFGKFAKAPKNEHVSEMVG
jgi:hypothetical protein